MAVNSDQGEQKWNRMRVKFAEQKLPVHILVQRLFFLLTNHIYQEIEVIIHI